MFDGVKSEHWGDDTTDTGEKCVHGHVVGDALRRGELRDPQTPGNVTAGVGDAIDDCGDDQACEAAAEEEGENADREADVQRHAQREKVHPIEDVAPDRA